MPAGADAPRDGWLAALARRLEAEQERWFLWLPVMLGIGIGIYFSLDSEPHLLTALSVGAVGIAARLFAPKRTLGLLLGSALMAIGLGFALAKVRVETVRAPVLVKQMRGEVRGFVELIEPRSPRGDRITLRVISLGAMPEEQRPTRVRITSTTSTPGLAAGDAVVVNATLMPPAGPALPGEYDFGRQAWFEQLGAVGYTRSAIHFDPDVGPAPSDLAFWNAIERFRHLVSARVRAVLPGESGAIADALITGERGGISPATNTAFRNSGLFHILSISGLHMAIMAGSVFFVVRLLLAAVPSLALRYPIKKWAAAAAMLGAIGYLLVSGSAFATVRSAIMISIMFIAVMLDRPALALRNVGLAALAILVVFPESLFDVGFQMSFAAVVALVSIYEALRTYRAWSLVPEIPGAWLVVFLGGIVTSTLIASAAVAPFAAYHFHNSQQYAVLANLIAIPICNLVVMPAALAALVAMPFGLEAAAAHRHGVGHRRDAVDGKARRRAARLGAAHTRDPDERVPGDGRGRSVAGAVAVALAVLWPRRHRRRDRPRADARVSRSPHRPRRHARCCARRRRTSRRGRSGTRVRARALAGARRRSALTAGGGEERRLCLRQHRLRDPHQGNDGRRRAPSGRLLRRLPRRVDRGQCDCQPARMHATKGRGGFLCGSPLGHARDLHRRARGGEN